jgi:hypothetical protein
MPLDPPARPESGRIVAPKNGREGKMKTKIVLVAVAVALLGLLVESFAFGSSTASRITEKETLVTNARFTAFKFIDEAPTRKNSTGDEVLIRASLKAGGASAGWIVIKCTSMSPKNLLQCQATAKIQDRGKLTVSGAFVEQPKVHTTFAITGGTGQFRNARGQLEVDDTGPNTATFAFHLLP